MNSAFFTDDYLADSEGADAIFGVSTGLDLGDYLFAFNLRVLLLVEE